MHLKSLLKHPELLSMTYDSAARLFNEGRIDADQWEAYHFLWTWSTARYSGHASRLQDRFCDRHGYAALKRRRNRVHAWIATAKKRVYA